MRGRVILLSLALGDRYMHRAGTDAWRVWEVAVTDGGPWTLDCETGCYVHMVEVAGLQNVTETLSPWTPTATMTWTPLPTETPYPTMMPSPAWTETPTVTPSCTAISTETPTTPIRTIEQDATALRRRIAEEWGMPSHVYVEVGE